jgi:SnoaL-like domain
MRLGVVGASVALLLILGGTGYTFAQAGNAKETSSPGNPKSGTHPFSEADAAGVMGRFRQALESDSERGLMRLFDAGKMQDYPAFRDQIAQFFDKYEAFQVQYRIRQVSAEEHVGVALVDFQLEATPNREASPNVRRNAQLRLVLAWEGKQWKIVDLEPRGLFE